MKSKDILFPCGTITLEGICHYPDGDRKFPGVVLCHPHPLYGGSMDNNVIYAVTNQLVQRSIIAFAFNFRGVGRSEGRYDDGIAEQDDVRAALSWLSAQAEVEAERLGLAGYSFGASVALPTAQSNLWVKALALISPALVDDPKIAVLKSLLFPKLIISGEHDEFIADDHLKRMYREAAEPKQLEIVKGTDHFWSTGLNDMAEKVSEFFSTNLAKTE